MDATVNIHNPLTPPLCFGTTSKIDSSNYTINSIWLSEQQAAQMCNFGRKHQRYLIAMHCIAWYAVPNRRRLPGLDKVAYIFTAITTQNTLIKWKSDFWTYTIRHVGRAG